MVRLCFITVNLLCDIAILVYGQSTVSYCPTESDQNNELSPNLQLSDVVCKNLLPKMERIVEKLESVIQEVKDARKMHLYHKVKACPSGFDFLPEADGCFKVIFQPLSWSEADKACRGVMPGVHLVAITNAAKQQAIAKYLDREFIKTESSACLISLWPNAGKSVWIGGQRQDSVCNTSSFVWKTLDSIEIPFSYSNWHLITEEPNCPYDAYCVHMTDGINYTWNDSVCRYLHCSLCEF